WPITEKSELVNETELRTSAIGSRVHIKSTRGSTGTPIRLIKNATGIAPARAATWLGLGWSGVEPGDRVDRLWGSPVTAEARRKASFSDRAMNRRTISVFEINDGDLERIWRTLSSFRPVWIYGYADALHRLARWA